MLRTKMAPTLLSSHWETFDSPCTAASKLWQLAGRKKKFSARKDTCHDSREQGGKEMEKLRLGGCRGKGEFGETAPTDSPNLQPTTRNASLSI